MTQRAVAHLISTHARGAGSPEVIVSATREPTSERIARFPIGLGGVESGTEILREAGWLVTSTWSRLERGYLVADVWRA